MTSSLTPTLDELGDSLGAFVLERHPFGLDMALGSFRTVAKHVFSGEPPAPLTAQEIQLLRGYLSDEMRAWSGRWRPGPLPDPTPGIPAEERRQKALETLAEDCDGFLHRQALSASFTVDERLELLRGMVMTRATDNRLKAFFTGGDVRYGAASFQGKGFRSLGQEAIYGAGLRLRRGERYRGKDGSWRGDVVSPLIRDAGVALAMRPEAATVRMILSAQMGKGGPPMNGKDLHVGDFGHGVLPPAAPLSIATLTLCGTAMAMAMEGQREGASESGSRVAVSFIGEGGSSLGEWHEAVNLCAARRLPIVFCVQNNQTALSTPVEDQSAVRTFADKAVGYGIPGVTVDGTDPEEVAAAFAWAAERARSGLGPSLVETVSLRICGHAHHDDMLYLGHDPPPSWRYPELRDGGYADAEAYEFWSAKDPIFVYVERLKAAGLLTQETFETMLRQTEELVEEQAQQVIQAPWPSASEVGEGVFGDRSVPLRREILEEKGKAASDSPPPLPPLEPGSSTDPSGKTFLEAIMLGLEDCLAADPRVFLYGQDLAAPYGNAFLLLKPLLERFGDRILNSTLAEGGILGVCVGAALAGARPVGEIQFNDFVATGFNQLVNNAAKVRYRWGGSVPMVVRMPWGGLRRAGPYHSQNTEAWFYRTPGLKIVAPSTPEDARSLLAAAMADPDPVLFFEHIALYRDPSIRQVLEAEAPPPLPLGKAALRRAGGDLVLVSYGAYVHRCLRVAEALAQEGVEAAVLDLRSLVPLDKEALLAVARSCGRVLIVHEDTRTGSIGESLAAILQEEVFEYLDAPVRILGALDTPVPYSPPLEDAFLPSDEDIAKAARLLARY